MSFPQAARSVTVGMLAAAVLAGGCSSGSGRQAAGTPSPAYPSASSAATATPTPTRSAGPTPTRTRTATPTPKPTVKPTAQATRVAAGRYAFPVRCSTSYGHSHHDYPATDIFAARGCAFVAVVSGRVDEVSAVDRWTPSTNRGADRGGLSVSIVGDDGVRYYGSHLEAIARGIVPGARVRAGQLLGRVGNTGNARGIATHVHFGVSWPTRAGVWWVRRGEVYPWPYLDSWRAGGNRSPAATVAAEHRRQGDVPPCRVDC